MEKSGNSSSWPLDRNKLKSFLSPRPHYYGLFFLNFPPTLYAVTSNSSSSRMSRFDQTGSDPHEHLYINQVVPLAAGPLLTGKRPI